MQIKQMFAIFILVVSTSVYAGIDAKKTQALINAFQAAHKAKDPDKLMNLVHWDRVEKNAKQSIYTAFVDLVERDVSSVELVPINDGEIFKYERNGVTYSTNLTPIGKLIVNIKVTNPGESHLTDVSFLVGEVSGEYIITTAAPAK